MACSSAQPSDHGRMGLTMTRQRCSMHGCTLAFSVHAVLAAKCSDMGLLAAGHICASWSHALARALRRANTACEVCGATKQYI